MNPSCREIALRYSTAANASSNIYCYMPKACPYKSIGIHYCFYKINYSF